MSDIDAKRKLEIERLRALPEVDDDPDPKERGVLLSDLIQKYVNDYRMIDPFEEGNLKPAGYELTIGDEHFIDGKYWKTETRVKIPPFQVAVIKTRETINLPHFLIGRWNIKVSEAYRGLLWVGGPQVDPGYVGHLFCPIYNLSDREVVLKRSEPIALMDFVKTTTFNKAKGRKRWERYPRPPKRPIIEDFGIDDLKSALYVSDREVKNTVNRTVDQVEDRLNQAEVRFQESFRQTEGRFATFSTITFSAIAIIVAAIAIYLPSASQLRISPSYWSLITLSLSLFAVLLSLLSLFAPKMNSAIIRWVFPKASLIGVFVVVTFIAFLSGRFFYPLASEFILQNGATKLDLIQHQSVLRSLIADLERSMTTRLAQERASRTEAIRQLETGLREQIQRLQAELENNHNAN